LLTEPESLLRRNRTMDTVHVPPDATRTPGTTFAIRSRAVAHEFRRQKLGAGQRSGPPSGPSDAQPRGTTC